MATEGPPTCRVQVAEHPRLLKLKEMFNSKFGSLPKFYVRAPGRVNIIGEHIDYCGYSVLPMAIEQDILIAVEPVKANTLQLSNTNPLYPDFSTSANDIQIDKTKPLWHNYFLCGFKGIQEHFGLSNLPGMNCLVDGTIPPSSGLSSSSAVVCCAGLVTITVLGMNLSKVFNNSNSTKTLEGPVMVDRLRCIQPFKGSGEAVEIDIGDAILIWKDIQIY